jgi:hypothetical protein
MQPPTSNGPCHEQSSFDPHWFGFSVYMNGCLVTHIVTDLTLDTGGIAGVGGAVCSLILVGGGPAMPAGVVCYLITLAISSGTAILAGQLNNANADCGGQGAILNDTWLFVTPWVSSVC